MGEIVEQEKAIDEKLPFEYKMVNGNSRFSSLVNFSGLPIKTYMTKRLFNFLPIKGSEIAYEACLKFVSGKAGHHFLTLAGETGRGKTHLALGIGWHWIEVKNKVIKYSQVESFLDELRSGFHTISKEDDLNFDMKLRQMKGVSLLILDDLGVEQSTEWARAKLDEIIDYRYINELPMVVTTNMAPRELGPRVASRLREGICVNLKCPDYRERISKLREG